MFGEITVHGIVLNTMPVGEYDRRVTILTAEKGKITAFARGARRAVNSFAAYTQPFTYAEFVLTEGKDAYNYKSVDKPHFFEELRRDPEGLYYGMYFCELAGYFTREGMREPEQMKLLYLALLALTKKVMPCELIRYAFELRSIGIYGEAPLLNGRYYSLKHNGFTDINCAGSIEICESALYTVQYVLTRPVKEVFSFNVSEEVLEDLRRTAAEYVKSHIDRPLKSLEMLEVML